MAAIACCVVLVVAWLSFVLTTSNATPKALTWVRHRLHSVRRSLSERRYWTQKTAAVERTSSGSAK